MGELTALQVKNAKPGRHADGKGLYLLVRPEGSRSWLLRVQVNGRRRDFGLGGVDMLGLGEARERAAEWRKLAKAGQDPAVEWRRRLNTVPTFEEAARQLHESIKAGWRNPKHRAQWLSTLQTYAFPAIGAKRVDQVDATDIQAVLAPIWLVKLETARRVRQRVGAVLDFAHGKEWRAAEAPMRALSRMLPKQRRAESHFAAMPYAEVPLFMQALATEDATMGRLALRFLVLTAARSGEVRGARWDEIDLTKSTWRVPASRMKGGKAHDVPLSAPALAVLKEIGDAYGMQRGALIFPGQRRDRPLSDMTMAAVLKRAGLDAYTVHGFRSSFRDWAAERMSTVPGDVVEAALAHVVKNKVEAAYRRTKFLDARRKLMERWGAYLTGDRTNVVRLATAG